MKKINNEYMEDSFNNLAKEYLEYNKVGLWESEKKLIKKYFTNKNKSILDMGCGSGRTTFGLEQLEYQNIVAVDFASKMIAEAKEQQKLNSIIKFEIGNCLNLKYESNQFDYILFSFNGLMQIPKKQNRIKALQELHRVLKTEGILIFTTHDRDNGDDYYKKQWQKEEIMWKSKRQDKRLYDFGDVITTNHEEEYFIHIPNCKEIEQMLKISKFNLMETFIRSKEVEENTKVKNMSDDCRFWIAKKL